MSQVLDASAISRFRQDGVIFPIRVMEEAQAQDALIRLEVYEARHGGRLPPAFNAKPHLLVPWLWALVHDPRIVDPVADLLGPDLLCWGTSFIAKRGGDARHVSWHQDATHWNLSSPEAVTAWLALTPSTRENGCVRMLPGTHQRQFEHSHPADPSNMLGRKERVIAEIPEQHVVDVVLMPGELSLHHALVIHGSEPNRSADRRVGFAIRYIPGSVRQSNALHNSATLVRGRDHGHFACETPPEAEFHPAAIQRHRQVLRDGMAVIFGSKAPGTGKAG